MRAVCDGDLGIEVQSPPRLLVDLLEDALVGAGEGGQLARLRGEG